MTLPNSSGFFRDQLGQTNKDGEEEQRDRMWQ